MGKQWLEITLSGNIQVRISGRAAQYLSRQPSDRQSRASGGTCTDPPVFPLISTDKTMSAASDKNGDKFCVCNFAWCRKKVNGGEGGSAHRLSNLVPRSGDTSHLETVLRQHLLKEAPDDAIRSILDNPHSRRVHTWHFSEDDKVPGQGGGKKLRPGAVPLARNNIPGARSTTPKTPAANASARPPRTPGTTLTGQGRRAATPGSARSSPPRQLAGGNQVGRVTRAMARRPASATPSRGARQPPTTPRQSGQTTPRHTNPTPSLPTPPSLGNSRRRDPASRDVAQIDMTGMDHTTLRRHAQELAKSLAQAQKLAENLRISRARQAEQDAENLRKAREELRRKCDENAKLAAALEEARRELDARNAELERIGNSSGVRLCWESVTNPESAWASRVNDLTGIPSVPSLEAAFDWVDCCGLSGKLKLWHHKQSVARMDAEEAGEALRDTSGHSDKKVSAKDSFLITLTKLCTGLSFRLLCVWFGVPYTSCVRIFSSWIPYMYHFFNAEFPPPTMEMLRGTTPRQWVRVYGGEPKYVVDATDYRMQQPSSRMAARTVWSEYKNGHTIKLLVCIVPAGAYVWSSDGFPGRISDIEICEHSGFYELIEEGDLVAADKGFDGIAVKMQELSARVIAPTRRRRGVRTFTSTEREFNEEQSNLRIHVERHMGRLQAWGFFSKKKVSIHYADIFGMCFQVASHLCNLQRPLHKESGTYSGGD